jgi:hypothetical protein
MVDGYGDLSRCGGVIGLTVWSAESDMKGLAKGGVGKIVEMIKWNRWSCGKDAQRKWDSIHGYNSAFQHSFGVLLSVFRFRQKKGQKALLLPPPPPPPPPPPAEGGSDARVRVMEGKGRGGYSRAREGKWGKKVHDGCLGHDAS